MIFLVSAKLTNVYTAYYWRLSLQSVDPLIPCHTIVCLPDLSALLALKMMMTVILRIS